MAGNGKGGGGWHRQQTCITNTRSCEDERKISRNPLWTDKVDPWSILMHRSEEIVKEILLQVFVVSGGKQVWQYSPHNFVSDCQDMAMT